MLNNLRRTGMSVRFSTQCCFWPTPALGGRNVRRCVINRLISDSASRKADTPRSGTPLRKNAASISAENSA